jgi:hypothetical protein
MAKLIITVEEKQEKIEGDRTLYGFGVTHDMDWEQSESSLLPSMGAILAELVVRAITEMQKLSGGCLHKSGTSDRSIPLESHMVEMKAELDQPFPSEI